MNKTIFKVATGISLLLMIATLANAQQSQPQNDIDYLETKMTRIADFQGDFLDFTKSQTRDTREYEAVERLLDNATQVYEYLYSLHRLLLVYDQISCKADKQPVARAIRSSIYRYNQNIDSLIKQANTSLSFTKIPAIATAGTQYKDDLRDIKAKLEAIKSNIGE